jgi:ethanolamine permease
MIVGIGALLTGKTAEIITIACFGAITLYIFGLISFFILRKNEPNLPRPFVAQLYPWVQIFALVVAIVSFISMMIFNLTLGLIYLSVMLVAYLWYKFFIGDAEKKAVAG